MIDNFSPLTRKFIAVAILFLGIMACLNVLIIPTIGLISSQLERLADTRFQRARLEEIQDRPLPAPGDPIPANLYIRAPSAEVAQSTFVALINELASHNSVSLEQAAIVPADASTPQRLAIDLSVAGPELALTSFINGLEAQRPMIRLVSWKVTAGDATQAPTRLSGRAVAVWSPAR